MANPNPPKEHQFSSTNQPANRGRKPSKLKKYFRDNSISSEDTKNAFKHVLGLSIKQLQDIISDPSRPAIIAVAASAVLKDFTKGKLNNTSTILRKAQVESEQQESSSGGGDLGGQHSNQQFHEYSFPAADSLDSD